jgi:hypothetical protein
MLKFLIKTLTYAMIDRDKPQANKVTDPISSEK